MHHGAVRSDLQRRLDMAEGVTVHKAEGANGLIIEFHRLSCGAGHDVSLGILGLRCAIHGQLPKFRRYLAAARDLKQTHSTRDAIHHERSVRLTLPDYLWGYPDLRTWPSMRVERCARCARTSASAGPRWDSRAQYPLSR